MPGPEKSPMKKRFIAGAKCPGCGAMDKIYMLRSVDRIERHCNQCDFSEILEAPPARDNEPGGAEDKPEVVREESTSSTAEISAIRIINPGKPVP